MWALASTALSYKEAILIHSCMHDLNIFTSMACSSRCQSKLAIRALRLIWTSHPLAAGCSHGSGCNICMGSYGLYNMHCRVCMFNEVCVLHSSTLSTCVHQISAVRVHYCTFCLARWLGHVVPQARLRVQNGNRISGCSNSCQHSDTVGMTRNTPVSLS